MSQVRRSALRHIAETWSPRPVSTSRTIHPEPVRAMAALLDQPDPGDSSDLLPPLWHWLHFVPTAPLSEVGDDGHPLSGPFLPPIPDRRRMFAGGRLTLDHGFRVGVAYERRTELHDLAVKHGRSGEMLLVTLRHTFSVGDQEAAIEEEDIVYRQQAGGAPRALPPANPPTSRDRPRPTGRQIELTTDPVTLFRFSALTYNSHRIHFDHPYATQVEGYPGLVVHGPLLAMLMAEVPRRLLPERRVSALDYRLNRPVFSGERIAAVSTRHTHRWDLQAGTPLGGPAAVGTARLEA